MMRILISALACVPFVIKHILLQNLVSTPTQALLALWIQLVQAKGMLHDVCRRCKSRLWPNMS